MATSCSTEECGGAVSSTKPEAVRGILKKSSSIDQESLRSGRAAKEMKWDEMNILQTYHPADKDYGHQKITDPPTPYSHMTESDKSGDEEETLDPEKLADCLRKKPKAKVLVASQCSYEEGDDDEDDDENLSEEAKAKKLEFRKKRKMHYDEFHAVRLRQQMIDDDEDEEDVNNSSDSNVKSSSLMQTDASETLESKPVPEDESSDYV